MSFDHKLRNFSLWEIKTAIKRPHAQNDFRADDGEAIAD